MVLFKKKYTVDEFVNESLGLLWYLSDSVVDDDFCNLHNIRNNDDIMASKIEMFIICIFTFFILVQSKNYSYNTTISIRTKIMEKFIDICGQDQEQFLDLFESRLSEYEEYSHFNTDSRLLQTMSRIMISNIL
jgi:hypothetical protein